MARQPRTPGAKTPTPEEVKQSDLDAVLGEPKAATSDVTSAVTEPVGAAPTEDLEAKKEYEEFLAWRANKSAAKPVAPHVPASGVVSEPVATRTHSFLSPDGWTTGEIE